MATGERERGGRWVRSCTEYNVYGRKAKQERTAWEDLWVPSAFFFCIADPTLGCTPTKLYPDMAVPVFGCTPFQKAVPILSCPGYPAYALMKLR